MVEKKIYVWSRSFLGELDEKKEVRTVTCFYANPPMKMGLGDGASLGVQMGGGSAANIVGDVRRAKGSGYELILGQNPEGERMPLREKDRKWFMEFVED